jgi:hypothetical protein
MYTYRVKFTGEGVFLHKKKDGGIAYQKCPGSVWPVPWPDHSAADRASPAGPPNCHFEWTFSRLLNPPGGRQTSGWQFGPTGLTAGASGPEAGAAKLIAGLLLGQPPTARFPPPINTPSSSWGRVRTSPTIVHL